MSITRKVRRRDLVKRAILYSHNGKVASLYVPYNEHAFIDPEQGLSMIVEEQEWLPGLSAQDMHPELKDLCNMFLRLEAILVNKYRSWLAESLGLNPKTANWESVLDAWQKSVGLDGPPIRVPRE